jgi:hypothetical protein
MALRFTRENVEIVDEAFPLRLSLVTEAELVQLFIARTTHPQIRAVDKAVIETRLEKWRGLRQPQGVPGITAQEVGAIARFWQSTVPGQNSKLMMHCGISLRSWSLHLISARAPASGLCCGVSSRN